MERLDELMARADPITDLDEYTKVVKAGVRGALTNLDPGLTWEETGYFNHSAVPDFVLSWPHVKEKRPLYIRRSYAEIDAGRDVEHFAKSNAVVLSVKEDAGASEAEINVRRSITRTSRSSQVLVTGGGAVDSLGQSAKKRATSGKAGSPLASMVAAELLPQGRGLIDQDATTRFVDPQPEDLAALQASFSESAFAGMETVAHTVAASHDPSLAVPQPGRDFTLVEARELIPWLLGNSDVRVDSLFWEAVAQRLSLKVLEGIHDHIEGLDLTRLIPHAWDRWEPSRGYQGIVTADTPGQGTPQYWYMSGKLLTCRVGGSTLKFATYGQALKSGRGSQSSATWEKIRPLLDEFMLNDVVLRGIDRSIALNAEESRDVKGDTDRVVSSLDDQFFVDGLTVALGARDEERYVRVDLGESLAFNEGHATLEDMIRVLGRIVSYREPIDVDALLAGVPTEKLP